ncbi:sulfatase-like hydrolase/transferase [Paenibacillus jiagnxiensis]|uniref:sulfatase-like hydrolase/transferase n=1 Tax=Paenibacillus jiagnxiensis TaxID=3228926 RepID=UPI0033B6CDEF
MSKKPNIVMIVADQWRADSIGYAGCEGAVTPNLDELAQEGISFTNAYCQLPVCVPSRSSFLSGWYPHTRGFRTMHHLMGPEDANILRTLKKDGYHVYWGGRNDFLRADVDVSDYCSTRDDQYRLFFKKMRERKEQQLAEQKNEPSGTPVYDYSHFRGVKDAGERIDWTQMKQAMEFITGYDEEEPFCVYLALALPHPPYQVAQEWYDRIDAGKVPRPVRLTEEEWEGKPSILRGIRNNQKLYEWSDEQLMEMKRVYYAMGTELDAYIGHLMETLKEKGVYEDTLVIFFSDHGDYTGDYEIAEKNQNTFEDTLTRVPLIMKLSAGMNAKPRVTGAMTELIDIQATLLDLLDITPDYTHFGKSLRPVLEGEDIFRDVVFAEGGRLEGEDHCKDAGHAPSNEYWARTVEQEKMPQHTKAMMIRDSRYKYVYRLYEKDEFYDMEQDSYERSNLIDRQEYAPMISAFKERMLRHFFETGGVVPHRYDKRT